LLKLGSVRSAPLVLAFAITAAACTGAIGDGSSPGADPSAGGGTNSASAPIDCTDPDQPGPRQLRLLTRDEYAATVADLLAIERPATDDLPVEPRVAGYDNNAAASIVTSRHVDAYLAVADAAVRTALKTKSKWLTCDLAGAPCRTSFIEQFGRRAFRRPLRADERARYEAMFAADLTGGSNDEGVASVVSSMFISPSFLYRSEIGAKADDGTYPLTPFELATALSYTFLGTTPDIALLDRAAGGKLATAADVESAARAMLADPRSRPQVARFFSQWLDTSALLSANKDKTIYPAFTDAVRVGLDAELSAFVNHVTFDSTHAFGELLSADYVFANDAVAGFYGLPTPGKTTPTRIAAGPNRGGILTLGAVLASHAHSNESSPIKRGKWVRDRLLCQDLPPPPANANTTPPGLDPTLTTRERFAKHTSDPSCRGCHQYIDGVGFSFERYDGIGAHRTEEGGKAIDASGEIKGREGLGNGVSETFEGPKGLAALLGKGEGAPRCFATHWFRFARGLKEEGPEVCAAKTLGSKFLEMGQDVRELMILVVTQRSFLVRRPS